MALIVVISVTDSLSIVAPNVRAGGVNRFDLGLILAFGPGFVWIAILESGEFSIMTVAFRLKTLLVLEFLMTLGIPWCIFSVAAILENDLAKPVIRNLIFSLSVSIILCEIAPRWVRISVPSAYLIATMTGGISFPGRVPDWWAFVMDSSIRDSHMCFVSIVSLASLALRLLYDSGVLRTTTRRNGVL